MFSPFLQQFAVCVLLVFSTLTCCAPNLTPRTDNGLAKTPIMGWNSYNHYSCSPNESIIHSNAQAVVDLGLLAAGYHYVTVDCGWSLPSRASNGQLTWNTALFPSGYPALGNFIHGLGLKFGVYADGGIQMCMTGSPAQAGSLGHEQTDANTFASWGADLLKYDNCYSDAGQGYPDTAYTPDVSPKAHFVTMSQAILSTGRPMVFQICEWGIDFPSAWAPTLGNSWRITNDIIPYWRTIPRILNQAVPQTSFAGPGQWLDLDMLEVGNKVFTTSEEQTHMSLWAILKSPLVIGAPLKDKSNSISTASLNILLNKDVISYNQDSLGAAASFQRRWTADEYEVWAGPLSGDRLVVALINLKGASRQVTLDLPDVGLQKAATLKDIWNGKNTSNVLTSYTASVAAHGTLLVELGGTTPVGLYTDVSTTSQTSVFSKIYAATTSSSYAAVLTFTTSLAKGATVNVNGKQYTSSSGGSYLTVTGLSFTAGNANTITVVADSPPSSLTLTPPPTTSYPSTAFSVVGSAVRTTCDSGLCAPVGSKIGNISPSGSASLSLTAPSTSSSGSKFATIYFCNNDIALSTSWTTGTNTRNLTISVNGVVTRIEVPLSGRSSELFSSAKGWQDTGLFEVLLPGWKSGNNTVVVGNTSGASGVVSYGADLVGMDISW